jgi:hypothetical protein
MPFAGIVRTSTAMRICIEVGCGLVLWKQLANGKKIHLNSIPTASMLVT